MSRLTRRGPSSTDPESSTYRAQPCGRWLRSARLLCLALVALVPVLSLGGCARGEGTTLPQSVMDLWVQFRGPVNDSAYYFLAFNKNPNFSTRIPVPIATGPFWGNGWGTGSMTHFLEYRLGQYEFYTANLTTVLRQAGGGILAVSGTPSGADAGRYDLTVGAPVLGAASVSGSGMISGVNNVSGQAAGSITISTDATGRTVAGSVVYTPTAGSTALTPTQQAQIAGLNAGGVALQTTSLDSFGLALTLAAATAGAQTITLAPTTATVSVTFVPSAPAPAVQSTASLRANSTAATSTPPIPGATITTGDLVYGGTARIDTEISQSPRLIGPPFAYTVPAGANSLRATIDLSEFGSGLTDLGFNVIATTELIYDPSVTDPAQHCYDGLGPLGNDAVTFSTSEYRTYSNADSFVTEGANDSTLRGNVTDAQRAAVDITDWSITLRRIR